jgi:sulfite reductase (NADPH) flavoprotein alpha-component
MLRTLHSIPALIIALLLVVVAGAGVALSIFPAFEHAGAATGAVDVATLAARVDARLDGAETIMRRPSGVIVAYHLAGQAQRASIVDPATGEALADWQPPRAHRWLRDLHRTLLLRNDGARIAVGIAAACLVLVVVSGLFLLARRMGGWRHFAGRMRGDVLQRAHDETARIVFAGLLLTALTGVAMSLATFGLLPEGGDSEPFGMHASGADRIELERMPALRSVDVAQLKQLKLADRDDPTDVIEIETAGGTGVVDPATGTWLWWQAADGWQRFHATVAMLHTGEGAWWLGLLLGLSSLTVPVLAATGFLLWLRRRRSLPRLVGNAPLRDADTLLLVGSEGNTTWGFAIALHDALVRAGLRVHTAPMNDLRAWGARTRRLLVLTATYGDGAAPASASRFLARLGRMPPAAALEFAVLGFGDRQFPRFCGHAYAVHEALVAHGLHALAAPATVDRQSEPEFLQWCAWLARTLDRALDVRYRALLPPTTTLQVVSREDYGIDAQTRTSVLRLAPVREHGRRARLPRFETGDLLGVVPPGGVAPRYYSCVSAAADGRVEICVRRQPGGACSPWLADLQPGATLRAFFRAHEAFRLRAGSAPVVLVGAGTGIGPLVGFIRHNVAGRPMHLYFGARSKDDGFLYGDELQQLVADGRLRTLTTAFSRAIPRAYVQDRLLADAARLRELVVRGACVMVCGGRAMAEGVARAWEQILAGSGLSLPRLRAQGRYVEDVY